MVSIEARLRSLSLLSLDPFSCSSRLSRVLRFTKAGSLVLAVLCFLLSAESTIVCCAFATVSEQ